MSDGSPSPAQEPSGPSGDAQPPKFIRRVVFEVALPNGERGAAVMYTTHRPAALATVDGAIQYRLVTEQYLKGLGLRALAIEACEIGLDDKLDSREALYRQLEADATRLLAANDPCVDIEL